MATSNPSKTAVELLGVRTQPRNARDRLLYKAIDLFYEHGFQAVGLDRIIDEVGVTKTTFYKHFTCKDELMIEAIKTRDQWERKAWRRAVRKLAGSDPREQLLALFDVLDAWFNDPEFRGCIFINVAAEFPNPHDPIHQAAVVHKKAAREETRNLAAAAGVADAETFADLYTAIVEGTLIMRHVHGKHDAARTARPMVESLLAKHLPAEVV